MPSGETKPNVLARPDPQVHGGTHTAAASVCTGQGVSGNPSADLCHGSRAQCRARNLAQAVRTKTGERRHDTNGTRLVDRAQGVQRMRRVHRAASRGRNAGVQLVRIGARVRTHTQAVVRGRTRTKDRRRSQGAAMAVPHVHHRRSRASASLGALEGPPALGRVLPRTA